MEHDEDANPLNHKVEGSPLAGMEAAHNCSIVKAGMPEAERYLIEFTLFISPAPADLTSYKSVQNETFAWVTSL